MFLSSSCKQLPGKSIPPMASSEDSAPTIAHRRTRRRNSSYLSEDLLIDIFLRLPTKCLMRFKSVSKVWYGLITSPNFVSTFKAQNKANEVTIYCQTQYTDTSTKITIGFHDIPFELTFGLNIALPRIVGCSDGLVCLSLSRNKENFAIWNPATRQSELIPRPTVDYCPTPRFVSSGFYYNPITNAHEIARLTIYKGGDESIDEADSRVQLYVFTLGSNSKSWTEKSLFLPLRVGFIGLREGVTCVNKYLFWMSYISQTQLSSAPHHKYILCFDMVHQLFTPIELPSPDWYRLGIRMTCYKDTLAIFLWKRGPPFDIWVLNDCGSPNHSWSLQRFDTPSLSLETLYPVTLLSKGGVDLWLVKSSSGSFIWDPQTGQTIKNVGITDRRGGFATYSPSLDSVC